MPVTINDIARTANVSRSTVSLVLRNETEGRVSPTTTERVLQIMADMNYRPHAAARQMRVDRSKTVRTNCFGCLFYVDTQPEVHPYFTEVLVGANEEARLYNQHLLMGHGQACAAQLKAQILTLTGDKVDGWLLGALCDPEVLHFLRGAGIPAVWTGSSIDTMGAVSQVKGDDFQGGYLAVKHLTELGHRRIACFMGSSQSCWVVPMEKGCRKALREVGIEDFFAPIIFHDDDTDRLQESIDKLFSEDVFPTALVIRSDPRAIEAIHCLQAMGLRVPEDVSVVGYDGLPLSEMSRPSLTTVVAPRREIGKVAIQKLRELVEATGPSPVVTELPVHLIKRDSTGPAPLQ